MRLGGEYMIDQDPNYVVMSVDGGPIKYASEKSGTGVGLRIGGHSPDISGQHNVYSFFARPAADIATWMDGLQRDTVTKTGRTDIVHPSYYAMIQHNAHWERYGQGYTEATNIESVRWGIVNEWINQPVLLAHRHGERYNVLRLPSVQTAIAEEQGNATAREQAQHRDPWAIENWWADVAPWLMVLGVGIAAIAAYGGVAAGAAAGAAETGAAVGAEVGVETAVEAGAASASDGVQVFALDTVPATVVDASGVTSTFDTVTGSTLVDGAVTDVTMVAEAGAMMPPAPMVDPAAQMGAWGYGAPSTGALTAGVSLPSLQTIGAGASLAATVRRLFSPVSTAQAALPGSPVGVSRPPTLPGQAWYDPIPIAPGTQPSAVDWLRSPGWAGLPVWMWLAAGGAGILLLTMGRGGSPAPAPSESKS